MLVTVPVSADVVTPCGNAVAMGKTRNDAAAAIKSDGVRLTATSGARGLSAQSEEQRGGASWA